jgi:sulfate adenylyltransferase subunit 2
LLHVDTRWKFQEMYQSRDFMARESGMDLLVHTNPEAIEKDNVLSKLGICVC